MPKSARDELVRRAPLDDQVRALRKAAALKAALELELFTRIAEGNRSLPALLKASGLSERGARLLLDALVNISLLNRSAFEYLLTPLAETYLVKGKPTYYGDSLLAQMAWDARGQTARSVKSGKPLATFTGDGNGRPLSARSVATWIDWAGIAAEFESIWEQLGLLSIEPTSPRQVLAIGAEAGVRLLSLAQRDEALRITLVDSDSAQAPLRVVLEALPQNVQYTFITGDGLDAAFPLDTFDLALLDSITAGRSLEQNIGILHRVWEGLKVGGRIVLRAPVADDDRKGPELVPLLGLDLLISSSEGDTYSVTEYRGMLEAAGFFEVKQVGDKPGVVTARHIPPPPPPPAAATVAPDFIPPPETLS